MPPDLQLLCEAIEDPERLWQDEVCLVPLSKNVEGVNEVQQDVEQTCRAPECSTLKSEAHLDLHVGGHDCEPAWMQQLFDGQITITPLVHAVINQNDPVRGPHAGTFSWLGAGLVVEGTVEGMTHVGTHRPPLVDDGQDCDAPGFLEGRLCGIIRQSDERPDLVGCLVVAAYRLQVYNDSALDSGAVVGTLEGVVVCPCVDRRIEG